MQALPHVAMFMKHGLQSERECSGSMEILTKMKGISFQELEEAKETMRKKCAFFCYKRKHIEGGDLE